MPRIAGNRILLREFRWEDLASMRKWITNEKVTHYLGTRYVSPQTWEQTENHLRALVNGDVAGEQLVIADLGTYAYLGQISLQAMDRFSQQAELAVVVAPDFWGKGIGAEAIGLMLRHAFYHLNLNRIWLKVFAEHERAIHLYEKCGFVREGILRQDAFLEGKFRDTIIMSVLREDFMQHCPAEE